MVKERTENPFVFGEVVDPSRFVDRERELEQLIRDVSDGQKVFLLSPRRFGKTSLVSLAFLRLRKRYVRTSMVTVSSYANYAQFLEKFAEKVLKAAGHWEQVKDWISRFIRNVRPEVNFDPATGEFSLSLGRKQELDISAIAPEIFALPGELAKNGGFRMAICLDEFQQVQQFDSVSIENALRNEVQRQREVGYVFSGSQPSLMGEMLVSKRPFHKAGPRMFLDKIPAEAWIEFISDKLTARGHAIGELALKRLLEAADLIPYDVQRIAHELWDYAELKDKKKIEVEDVELAVDQLVVSESVYYERLWEQLTGRQRAALQAMAERGPEELLSQTVREKYRLGPASSVQRALQSLGAQDILDRYQDRYFFIDPILSQWIRKRSR
jgi:uncharacterized protein